MDRNSAAFLAAAADVAHRREIDMVFYRDDYEGWIARANLRDARGIFTAEIGVIAKAKDETGDDYDAKISKAVAGAIVAARKRRQDLPAFA